MHVGEAPAGVTGKLIADGAGAWLQTPAGWTLVTAVLGHELSDSNVTTFDLLRVCLPPVATVPAANVPVTTVPVATGPTLPVTGANTAIITGGGLALVALGAALFLARRRRNTVRFIA